jgi:predicted ATPase
VGEQLLQLAQVQDDPALEMEARFALGSTEFFVADYAAAAENFGRVLALDSRGRDRSYTFITGQDVSVTCRCFRALNLWQLGYPEQALDSANEAIGLAREIGHPFTLAGALTNTACLHQLRREPARVEELAREAIAISQEKGFFWVAQNNVFLGWALALRGPFDGLPATKPGDEPRTEQIVQLLLNGANAVRESGARISQTNALAMLVESYTRLGLREEADAALKQGLESVAETGERPWEVELHRLAGELALATASGVPSEAEAAERAAEESFTRAVEIGRKLGARSLELRAATSLGRLWRRQGRGSEARDLVVPTYEWFEEGFDSPDLQEAQALLDALE